MCVVSSMEHTQIFTGYFYLASLEHALSARSSDQDVSLSLQAHQVVEKESQPLKEGHSRHRPRMR